MTASTEADIINDLRKKTFSVRQSGEKNIFVTKQIPKLQSTTGDRRFQKSWCTKKDWLCDYQKGNRSIHSNVVSP